MNTKVFDSFPVLETERLTLQLYEEANAADIFEMRTDPKVLKYTDRHPPKDQAEVINKIKEIRQDFKDKKGINWTIKLKSSPEVIGYIGFWRIDYSNHRLEIGYTLKSAFWRKGITYEAACRVIDFAFHEMKAHSIMANINPDNSGSEALLLKLGFRKEAYFREDYHFDGKFLDSVIYCLLVSDWKK